MGGVKPLNKQIWSLWMSFALKLKRIRNNQVLSYLMLNSLACLFLGLLALSIHAHSIVAVLAGVYGLTRCFKEVKSEEC